MRSFGQAGVEHVVEGDGLGLRSSPVRGMTGSVSPTKKRCQASQHTCLPSQSRDIPKEGRDMPPTPANMQ